MRNSFKYNGFIWSGAFFLCLLSSSCDKEKADLKNEGGTASVIFSPAVADFNTNSAVKSKAGIAKTNNVEQRYVVELDDKYVVECVLTESASDPVARAQANMRQSASKAAAVPVQGNTIYGVTYYNKDGQYAGFNRFRVGETVPRAGGEVKLNGGEKYTFIFQSNHTDQFAIGLPASTFSLNNAVVDVLSYTYPQGGGAIVHLDQMYARVDQVLKKGENNIPVLFDHLFSQITVSLDAKNVGTITKVGTWSMSPHYAKVVLKASDGSLQYKTDDLQPGGKPIDVVLSADRKSVESAPFLVAANDGLGTIQIDDITVGEVQKSLTIPEVPILRGKSYKLSLTLKKNGDTPPLKDQREWAPGNLIESGGKYYFASAGELGSAFGWRSKYSGEQNAVEGSEKWDPCSLVTSDGGRWRTPLSNDWRLLLVDGGGGGTNFDNIRYEGTTVNGKRAVKVTNSYQNIEVIFPKTPNVWSLTTPPANLWKLTRVPITISDAGYYWSWGVGYSWGVTRPSWAEYGDHGQLIHIFDTGSVNDNSISQLQWRVNPGYVRCVRDKQ